MMFTVTDRSQAPLQSPPPPPPPHFRGEPCLGPEGRRGAMNTRKAMTGDLSSPRFPCKNEPLADLRDSRRLWKPLRFLRLAALLTVLASLVFVVGVGNPPPVQAQGAFAFSESIHMATLYPGGAALTLRDVCCKRAAGVPAPFDFAPLGLRSGRTAVFPFTLRVAKSKGRRGSSFLPLGSD